jgi:hypothetical protein
MTLLEGAPWLLAHRSMLKPNQPTKVSLFSGSSGTEFLFDCWPEGRSLNQKALARSPHQ